MQFKRPRLVVDRTLVNAGLAASLIFLAACGNGGEREVPEADPSGSESAAETALMLPAVWSTSALDGPVADIALAGGGASLLAVAYEGNGLELFDLEAERVAEIARFAVAELGQGTFIDLDGAELTLFPGIDTEGAFKAYLFGANLMAPAEIDLPIEANGTVAGLCATPGIPGSPVIMQLAYWTAGQADLLVRGDLSVEEGEFAWTERNRVRAEDAISTCMDTGQTLEPLTGPLADAVRFQRAETERELFLSPDGALSVSVGESGGAEEARPIGLRDGLSVRTPPKPVAMDALASPRGGGYPFGLIVVAGETGNGHQVVFVDAGPLVSSAEAAGE